MLGARRLRSTNPQPSARTKGLGHIEPALHLDIARRVLCDGAMNWISIVLTSEFVWGIAIGVLLSIVTSIANAQLSKRVAQENFLSFAEDLASSICTLVDSLENAKTSYGFVDREYLDLIEVEISIFGRNREHAIALKDQRTRQRVQEFFTRALVFLVRSRQALVAASDPANAVNKDRLLAEADKQADALIAWVREKSTWSRSD